MNRSLDGTEAAFRTNQYGLFDQDHPPRKQKGTLRVLLLGDSGIVSFHPGSTLIEQLRGRFEKEKVELILGAVPGFSLPQLQLLQKELIQAYQPDVVMLYFNFVSSGLNSTYSHLISERLGNDGLVEKMGYINFLWPVPESMAAKFWGVHVLRQLATKLRAWQEWGLLVLGVEYAQWFMPARQRSIGIVELNRQYVQSMEYGALESGAQFFLLRGNSICSIPDLRNPQYKSEYDALKGPFGLRMIRDLCVRALDEVHTADPRRTIPLGALSGLWRFSVIRGDIHMNSVGTRLLTDIFEVAIRKAFRQFDRYKPGVRRRLMGRESGVDLRS